MESMSERLKEWNDLNDVMSSLDIGKLFAVNDPNTEISMNLLLQNDKINCYISAWLVTKKTTDPAFTRNAAGVSHPDKVKDWKIIEFNENWTK